MRKIIKIAKLELSILFYSPVAWLVSAIFMVQCGMTFLDILKNFERGLAMGYDFGALTAGVFAGNSGFFAQVPANLYLYLPILTMGLMSREISSGSIKLLLSSPVKLREIILGKYLAIISYGFTLILILIIYAVIGLVVIDHVDVGMVLSGLFGLFLLICAYAAIGLFMSCLTSYQVVAAISTLTVFAALRYVGGIGQNIDFVRDLTYFLSIQGRTGKMTAGLITTKDVAYYIIIISSFLMLCILRLKAQRELKSWTIKAGRCMALIICALMLGYITSRPMFTGYLDVTAKKSLTITKKSQELAKKFIGQVKVTTYSNLMAPNLWATLPEARNGDLSKLEPYQRFIPSMDFDYVYYYQKPSDSSFADYRYMPGIGPETSTDEIATRLADNMGISKRIFLPPSEINKLVDLAPEKYFTVRKLEYKGKSAYLRFYVSDNDQNPGEPEVMAALKRLLTKYPKAVFLTGNNERGIANKGDREYEVISAKRTTRLALINQGFDVDTVNINKGAIPDDADIVIIADPTVPFDETAQQNLVNFIHKGGNMFITGEPGRQEILNPILAQFGVALKQGVLVKPDVNLTPGFINATVSGNATDIDSNMARLYDSHRTVAVQGAAAIDHLSSDAFMINPILLSNDGGWNKSKDADLNSVDISFDEHAGDEKGAFPIVVGLSRKLKEKEQRIIVSGDADFISNGEFSRTKRGENKYFMDGLFRWLSNGTYPVDVTRPPAMDTTLSISKEAITVLMYVCKAVIPALIGIFGAILLFRRRSN